MNRSLLSFCLAALSFTGCALNGTNTALSPNSDCKSATATSESAAINSSKKSQKTTIAAKSATKLPVMNLVVNKEVQKELADLKSKPRTVERALEERVEHLPKMEQIFSDEGVPSDLVNLAFVESGFNEQAKSPAGAVGIWQFMKSTAKHYGLKIDIKEDQRKDIILSSLAAARHLRDLYNNYQDWYLALAAYNVGVGGIEKAMVKGNTRDFWELVRKGLLPKETARFVPRIVAAAIIMKNPEAHGFGAQPDIG